MPQDTFEFHISVRRLLIGLLITIVPISLFALYTISTTTDELEAAIGSHFKTIAEVTAIDLAQFIRDRVELVTLIAADPVIAEANYASNQSYQGMSEEAFATKIQRIEDKWNTPAARPRLARILTSRASLALRRYVQVDPSFLRINITDMRGGTVTATRKPFDYFQGDEERWTNIYADGRGALGLTEIHYDEVTKANHISIGVPVFEQGAGQFAGVVHANVNVTGLFPLISKAGLGPHVRTLLVNQDSTVIAGPNVSFSSNLKSEEHKAVIDALGTLQGRQTGYVVRNLEGEGDTLIAFAGTGLGDDYEALGWTVIIAQPTRDAFAPIMNVERLILWMAFVSLGAVIVLAVYFSLHRKGEIHGMGKGPIIEQPPKAAVG